MESNQIVGIICGTVFFIFLIFSIYAAVSKKTNDLTSFFGSVHGLSLELGLLSVIASCLNVYDNVGFVIILIILTFAICIVNYCSVVAQKNCRWERKRADNIYRVTVILEDRDTVCCNQPYKVMCAEQGCNRCGRKTSAISGCRPAANCQMLRKAHNRSKRGK